MSEWRIKICVWGFHGSNREDDVGPEFQLFSVPAIDDFATAVRYADAFCMGIRCNPKVWQAKIVEVAQVKQ